MKTRISKAYRGKEHIGWKKTVAGREWFLGYGTSPADEANAIALAELLEAKWRILKASGHAELAQTDFEEAKELITSRPRWSAARRSREPEEFQAPTSVLPSCPREAIGHVQLLRAPTPAPPPGQVTRWLHPSIDEFAATTGAS